MFFLYIPSLNREGLPGLCCEKPLILNLFNGYSSIGSDAYSTKWIGELPNTEASAAEFKVLYYVVGMFVVNAVR